MDEPKVSIIVPVYNAENTLEHCVRSVLEQEFRDFELILVDDGSTDGSSALCDRFAEQDARVLVVHKQNGGASAARNDGLNAARGAYVQFCDCDDWITADATKLMVRAMEETTADMVIADFYRVVGDLVSRKGDIDVGSVITREQYANFMLEDPADYYYGVLWNKLFKRSIIEEYNLRMDPELTWCEDFIFNMEYVLHCELIAPIHAPVYYYVKTEGSLVSRSMSIGNIVRMKLNVIDYYRDFYQRIYDAESYRERRADVYRFLVDVAGDHSAPFVLPSTKRLGNERAQVAINPHVQKTALTDIYYASKLIDRSFDSLAERFDLDPQDVKVFAYIKYAGEAKSVREIADFTGAAAIKVVSSVQRMLVKHLLHLHSDATVSAEGSARVNIKRMRDDGLGMRVSLGSRSEALSEAVDIVVSDFGDIAFADFSEADREQATLYLVRAMDNIRRVL